MAIKLSPKIKKALLLIVSLSIAVIFIYKVAFKDTTVPQKYLQIYLDEIKKELSNFIVTSLDLKENDFSLNCNSEGQNCNEVVQDPTQQNIASLTWKVLFYSDLYLNSDEATKQQVLDKALALTNIFLHSHTNKWNTQAFVFAYAYWNTKNVDFLKAFFYSSTGFLQRVMSSSTPEDIFGANYRKSSHPMFLIRYAEQLYIVRKLLQTIPPEILNTIHTDFSDAVKQKHEWLISNKEQIIEKSKLMADMILHEVPSFLENKALPPIRLDIETETKLDSCWLAYGYALGYKHSEDPILSNAANNLLKEFNLQSGMFEGFNAYYAQASLACLNTITILQQAHQLEVEVTRKFLDGFLNLYLDNNLRPLCSRKGGILSKIPLSSKNYSTQICEANMLTIANNVWLYDIIYKIADFPVFLSDKYSMGEKGNG